MHFVLAALSLNVQNARLKEQHHISLSLEQLFAPQAALMVNIAMFLRIVALSATLTALHVWELPQTARAAG